MIDPIKEVAKDLIKSTCQLYLYENKTTNMPTPHGCCILLEHNQKYFAVSNAHVLYDDFFGKPVFLLRDGKSSSIGGKYFTSRLPPSQKREDDLLDIAIVDLNESTTNLLREAGHRFLKIYNVKTGHKQNTSDELLMIGHPASRTKYEIKDGKVGVNSFPFYFKTHAHLKQIKGRYTTNYHFFAHYPRTKIFLANRQGRVMGPKPNGLSGSGMWLLQLNEDGLYKAFLIGIFMEYEKNRSLFVSTKIDFFIDVIRQKIDASIPNFGSKVTLLSDR